MLKYDYLFLEFLEFICLNTICTDNIGCYATIYPKKFCMIICR